MSDQHDAGSLPELTPEEESAVRQLLAEARHDVPIPSDVADRLDTVLAGLSRDEPAPPESPPSSTWPPAGDGATPRVCSPAPRR